MQNKGTWVVGGLSVVALVMSFTCLICSRSGGLSEPSGADAGVLRSRRIRDGKDSDRAEKRKAVRIDETVRAGAQKKKSKYLSETERAAGVVREMTDDRQLDELARHVIKQLQDAVSIRDFPKLQALVAKIMSSPKAVLGMASIPVAVRKAIVQALGGFGPMGLPELVEFLGDPDPVVASMAEQTFTLSLSDFSIGDYDRSPLIVAASQILTEETAVTEVMMNLSSCRPSVMAETVAAILERGTPEAQEAALKKMRFLANDESIKTVDDIVVWLENNPDPANADRIFGGYGRNK